MELNSGSLYELLGLQDFSTTETVCLRIAEMELKYGDDLSKNIPEDLVSRLQTAAEVLKSSKSKQQYDVLLRAKSGSEPTLPRFANSNVENQILSLAKLVDIELERAGELTYRVGKQVVQSTSPIRRVESRLVFVGQKEIEFSSVGFGVDSSLAEQPMKIALFSEPPQTILVDLPDWLRLQTGDEGVFIFVSMHEIGQRQLFAAGTNCSRRFSSYMPQAAQQLFGGSPDAIARLFGIRAKKQRIQNLVLQFHRELAGFAGKHIDDFSNSLSEQVLINYIKTNSYLF